MRRKIFLVSLLVLLVFLLTACNLTTLLGNQAEKVEVAVAQTLISQTQTVLAAPTKTEASVFHQPATATPLVQLPCSQIPGCVTETPLWLPSATLTVPSVTPWFSPTVKSLIQAKWLWQSPDDYYVFYPDEKFTMVWAIQNTGNVAWSPQYYLRFVNGFNTALYVTRQPLNRWVQPGETIEIHIPSHVPKDEDKYYQAWKLTTDQNVDFYTVDFYFTVKKQTVAPTQTPWIIYIIPTHRPQPPLPPFPPPPPTATNTATNTATLPPPTSTNTATPTESLAP